MKSLTREQVKARESIYRLIYCIGFIVSLCFIVLLQFTDIKENLDDQLTIIYAVFAAATVLTIVGVALIWIKPNSNIGFGPAVIGPILYIVVDAMCYFFNALFIGMLICAIGAIISLLGIALFYLGDDDERVIEKTPAPSRPATPSNDFNGVISWTRGEMSGGVIKMQKAMAIGRNPSLCNIILKGEDISGLHCTVRFDKAMNSYVVTDKSSNGTFFSNGARLAKNEESVISRGTELVLGKGNEAFRLE